MKLGQCYMKLVLIVSLFLQNNADLYEFSQNLRALHFVEYAF